MDTYPVKYIPAQQYEEQQKIGGTRKYTNLFMIISIVYLILIFFFTLIIYSSLYGHQELYNRHHKVHQYSKYFFLKAFKAQVGNYKDVSVTGNCKLTKVEDIDSIRNYHQDEHPADFVFCYIILGISLLTFFIWIGVFTSKGKLGGLNSKGAIAFLVFLFFLLIAATLAYFVYFMIEGEDNISNLERIDENLEHLLNKKCFPNLDGVAQVSMDYIQGYIQSIIKIIRPFVIVNFIISCIYFLIWIGLLGASASKQSLCHPL